MLIFLLPFKKGNKPQSSFYRALHSLTHPISLSSIFILLINDHYLRLAHPSRLTGKISDIAWLIFAPLICIGLASWIIRSERYVGVVSFSLIGLWFVAGKTIPTIHDLTLDIQEAIFGWRGSLRLDSSDLVALPALLIGWFIWQQSSSKPMKLDWRGGCLLALGILGTLGNSLPMDSGVSCVVYQEHHLYAFADTIYESQDGGLHWEPTPAEVQQLACSISLTQLLTNPENPQRQYRLIRNSTIQESTDGGQHWQIIYDLKYLEDGSRIYFQKNSNPVCQQRICNFSSDPSNMVYHPPTGNLIFSMGVNGILVYQPNGHWQWVAVGNYRYFDQDLPPRVIGLVRYLAPALGLLILIYLIAYRQHRPEKGYLLYLCAGIYAVVWVTLVMIHWLPSLAPERYWDPIWETLIPIGFLILIVQPVVPFSLSLLHDVALEDRKSLFIGLAVAMLCALVFLLPYVLWSTGNIATYTAAKQASLFLSGSALLLTYPIWRRDSDY